MVYFGELSNTINAYFNIFNFETVLYERNAVQGIQDNAAKILFCLIYNIKINLV